MATAKTLTLTIVSLLSFFAMTASLPASTLLQAAEILSNSGYLSMSLTLQLISNTLIIPHSPSLTIFSPSDTAFTHFSQPSLSLLQFHLSPLSFHLNSLKTLPSGSKIPTLSSNLSITVTTDSDDIKNGDVSVNGVKIIGSPYDDGSLIILCLDEFLDPGYVSPLSPSSPSAVPVAVPVPVPVPVPAPVPVPVPSAGHECGINVSNGASLFRKATDVLRSNGCSVMASFLDLQLMSGLSKDREKYSFTVFAPLDEVMKGFVGDVDRYSGIFLRHVLPCKITRKDLANFDDGMVFDTFLEGFGVTISRSGDILMLNEVPVSFPDMFQNDWLVVHGLRGILEEPERHEEDRGSSSSSGFVNEDDS